MEGKMIITIGSCNGRGCRVTRLPLHRTFRAPVRSHMDKNPKCHVTFIEQER